MPNPAWSTSSHPGARLAQASTACAGTSGAITAIAAVASQFGSQPDGHLPPDQGIHPRACSPARRPGLDVLRGGLLADSSLFRRPDIGHRTSPFFQTTLKLHTIASAQARHDAWAADEHDRIHDRPRSGRILEGGEVEYDKIPANPFRQTESVS